MLGTPGTNPLFDPRLGALRNRLMAHLPRAAPAVEERQRAAVALVVRPVARDLELLLIQRTFRSGDPWSGHMAFPGGRSDPADADSLTTAIRETREEVGIDLRPESVLGSLDEVHPRSGAPSIVVAPFVFAAATRTVAVPNHEVARALWVPLGELSSPGAATEYLHDLGGGQQLRFPAVGYREYTIWGLTHRILLQFLELANPG